jgi:hypothetical protein
MQQAQLLSDVGDALSTTAVQRMLLLNARWQHFNHTVAASPAGATVAGPAAATAACAALPCTHLCLLARLLCLLRGLVEVVLDHLLQRVDVHLLAHVPVLHQGLLGVVPLLHLHAQVNQLEHDLLVGLAPCPVLLAGHNVVQLLQRAELLAYQLQLISTLERVLRAGKAAPMLEAAHDRTSISMMFQWKRSQPGEDTGKAVGGFSLLGCPMCRLHTLNVTLALLSEQIVAATVSSCGG